ncbi:MAG: beta-lactamase family protein [Actinobacteria bacterium]|nr:beta-lactamase family protein [Actinomycetota bacterium]
MFGPRQRTVPLVLSALGLAVASCATPTAESGGPESVSTVTTTPDNVPIDHPASFPDPDVDRVTIAPFPPTSAPPVFGVPGTEVFPPLTGWEAFDAYLNRVIIGGGSSAASVAVSIDGEIVHRAAMGVRTRGSFDLAETQDRFRIGSISKPITAIAMLQLVEEGVIGLDDPVGGLVAEGLNVDQPRAGTADITVRNLLTHTSGFGPHDNLFFGGQVESCEEAARTGFERSLQGAPGGAFRYSNMNFCVLGIVIEQLTGQPYEEVVYERLLTPLGISGMRLAPTFDPGPDEVEHYSSEGRNYMEVLGGAGAWIATPSDLVTIIDSLDPTTPGWKPLEPETVALMKTSVNDPSVPDRGYGMGMILYGGGNAGHTGTIESTHAMLLDRADNVTWAITVSGDYPKETPRLATIIDDALIAGGFISG